MSCWNVGSCGAFSVQAFVFAVMVYCWGLFVGVAISCMYLVLASLFLEMISVAELQLLTMGLSDMGVLCVFFRKYRCGVLVLCGGIKKLYCF